MSKVFAFDSKYNNKANVQKDIILLKDGEKFLVQRRSNLLILSEKMFDNLNKALNEFDGLIL